MTGGGQSERQRPLLHLLVTVAFALSFAVWRVAVGDPVTETVEARLLDLRFRARGDLAAPQSVAIVAIDERTVTELGWTPPPRGAIAEALRRVLDAGPAAVGVDLLLLEQTAAGPAVGAAVAGDERVVLAAAVTGDDRSPSAEWSPEVRLAIDRSAMTILGDAPAGGSRDVEPELLVPRAEIATGAPLGHVNVALSADRVARRVPLGIWIGETTYLPSMSLEVARIAAGLGRGDVVLAPGRFVLFGDRRIDIDRAGTVVLNPHGGRNTIASVSLVDVLNGRLDPALMRDRAVFFGATAESLGDLFATPYSSAVPGVEVLATLAANLLDDDLIRRGLAVRTLDVVLALLLAAALSAALLLRRPGIALFAASAVWIGAIFGLHAAFVEWRLWLDATTVIATLLFATAWMGAQRLRMEKRAASEMALERANLAHFVSPAVVEQLARGTFGRFEGTTHDAAVMFVDVAGYTSLSETLAPSRTAEFLRDLHKLFERCATVHGGVITVFVGDGAMIVFGLTKPNPRDPVAAVRCGRMLLEEAGHFTSNAIVDQRLALRVSVHFGPVSVAILGGDRQAQVTVTGDTVNVASRLQEVAKAHATPFVISRPVHEAVLDTEEQTATGFVPLPGQPIRGRGKAIDVFFLASYG